MIHQFESDSSLVASARYDTDTQQLTVSLNGKGGLVTDYTFEGYPASEWAAFEEAESKGRYFSQHIRPMYVGRRQP